MKGFTDDQRERIQEDLLDAGRTLFAQYGLGKTTIADLTGEVGIGTSTFYQFYDSKEALYLAVLDAEGEAIARRLTEEGVTEGDDPETVVREFLRFLFDEIETNPLVRQLIVSDELDRLREYRTPEEREIERAEEVAAIRAFTDPFVEAGAVHGDDPELVARAVGAVPYLTLHEEDIGVDHYPEVRDFVIDTFARGLAVSEE
ncbi:TetR/AcrR family transcriptional regulator [Haloferax sulfurifontis]|uniref:Transcription regulator n=1 Tax=Haloferax sulfurifontis ATCC BAA-897 TaxID=662480 RepID=M0ILH2_9EURY|nr:TetR/AcrR family transcriptional regulator [Haloferax sulfurifontis]ELZ96708.1 transcription regulator [Haloferax sulfurifontis ATCC BAA-897]